MLTLLMQTVDDRLDVTWTAVEKRNNLNKSMRFVARQVAKYQGNQNYAPSSATVTTDGTNKTFATSQPSYYKFWNVVRTDTPTEEPVNLIDVRDAAAHSAGGGFDTSGLIYAYTSINTSGDTILGFPVTPAANLTFRVEFIARPSELATDGSAASDTWTLLPVDWHELAVFDAALRMQVGNGGPTEDIAARRNELLADLVTSLSQRKATRVLQTRTWNRNY